MHQRTNSPEKSLPCYYSIILICLFVITTFGFAAPEHALSTEKVRPAVELYDTLPYISELASKLETRMNLALNKPVTADGYLNGENPEQAVDGQTADNSKWCFNTGRIEPHWLTVDLQQVYSVDTFIIRHAGDGGETTIWNTSDYCIQSSPNGVSNWSDLVCIQGNNQNISKHVINSTLVRYLRLYITKPAQDDNAAVRVYEIEVYGPCDGFWIQGDISGQDGVSDCHVDLYDLQIVAEYWSLCNEPMDTECHEYWQMLYPDMDCLTVKKMNYLIHGDVNFDCNVNLQDLLILSENWLNYAGPESVPTNTFQEWGNESMSQLTSDFKLSSGLYGLSLTDRWPAFAWPQGIMFGAMVAAAKVDIRYLAEAETLADLIQSNYWCSSGGYSGYNASAGNCGDRYTDDVAWIALALLELHDITNNSTYLNRAEDAMEFIMSYENGAGDIPEGGIRWHETNNCGTRTCSNGPSCLANLILYHKTGNSAYLDNGLRLYNWAIAYGLRNPTIGLYYEGVFCDGAIDYGHLGYDTAPTLQAAVWLYQITNDSDYLTEARHLASAMETNYVKTQTYAMSQSGKWCGHDMTNALVDLYNADGDQHWLDVAAGYLTYLHDNCKFNSRYPVNWDDTSGGSISSELLDQASVARAYWTLASTYGGTTPYYPVIVFENCNYGGWSLGLDYGDYTLDDLNYYGINNNSISSLKVAKGYTLTLHSGDNFSGARLVKTSEDSCLVDNGWNDTVSSLSITPSGQ